MAVDRAGTAIYSATGSPSARTWSSRRAARLRRRRVLPVIPLPFVVSGSVARMGTVRNTPFMDFQYTRHAMTRH